MAKGKDKNVRQVYSYRMNDEEKMELITKAKMFAKGNENVFIREAIHKYKPIKKVSK